MPKMSKMPKMNGIDSRKQKILTIQDIALNILAQNFGLPSSDFRQFQHLTFNTQHSTLTLSTQNLKLKTQNFLLLTSILIQ